MGVDGCPVTRDFSRTASIEIGLCRVSWLPTWLPRRRSGTAEPLCSVDLAGGGASDSDSDAPCCSASQWIDLPTEVLLGHHLHSDAERARPDGHSVVACDQDHRTPDA